MVATPLPSYLQPAVQPTQPAVQPTQPAVQPTQPAVQPTAEGDVGPPALAGAHDAAHGAPSSQKPSAVPPSSQQPNAPWPSPAAGRRGEWVSQAAAPQADHPPPPSAAHGHPPPIALHDEQLPPQPAASAPQAPRPEDHGQSKGEGAHTLAARAEVRPPTDTEADAPPSSGLEAMHIDDSARDGAAGAGSSILGRGGAQEEEEEVVGQEEEEEDMIGAEEDEIRQRAVKHERRGSGDGPSVPQPFREAAAAESSRSHEFRQKLMRLVVGNGESSASAGASAQASPGMLNASAAMRLNDAEDVSDASAEQPAGQPGGAGVLAWPSQYVP